MQTFPTYSAVNPKTNSWRDLTSYLTGNRIEPLESLVTGPALWSWGSRHFTRIDLATMTHRPVAPVGDGPAVTGLPTILAETDDCVWAIARDDFLDSNSGHNIHRLFAVMKADGTVQSAILLPMVCRITCAVIVGKTLWLGVERRQTTAQNSRSMPCLVRVPLGR